MFGMETIKRSVARWVLGRAEATAEASTEEAVAKIPQSKRSTILGIIYFVIAIGRVLIPIFDNDPNTHANFDIIDLMLFGGGFHAVITREQKAHDEQARIERQATLEKYVSTIILACFLSQASLMAQTRSAWIGASVDASAQTNAAGHACLLLSGDDSNYSISCIAGRGGSDGFSKPVYDAEEYYGRKLTTFSRFTVLALAGAGISNGQATTGLFSGGFAVETPLARHIKVAFLAKGAFSPGIENNAAPRFGIVFGYDPN